MKTPLALSVAIATMPFAANADAAGPFEPTWESTDAHNAAPEWFRDAKFGVYWHWGAFSTPQFGSEWYGRDMYRPNTRERNEHTKRYGTPEEWGYENFILGKEDLDGNLVQFKPKLASQGGDFDPESWMRAIKASGAKFAGPVAEHHDGFSMWDSQVNEWNSAEHGPNLDLVELFADLVRKNDMKLLVAMHQAYNTNGFFGFAPKQTDESLKKLFGQLPKEESDQLWFDKQREVLDHVQPDIIWNDFGLDSPGWCHGSSDICGISEEQRLNYLAYYFNRGVEWDKEVLTTYKHFDSGFRETSAVADWERGGPADLTRPYWLTDDAISSSTWSYTEGMGYYSTLEMLHSLIDRISKNGNVLLNVSPTAAGVLPKEQEDVLIHIGDYLERFGESIYDTRAWHVYGEGPNRAGGGSFTAPLRGNGRDIRFTRDKDEKVLYATILGWPEDSKVNIETLGSSTTKDLSGLKSVQIIGDSAGQYTDVKSFNQGEKALEIELPNKPADSEAYVIKLNFESLIPVPQLPGGASLHTECGSGENCKGIALPKGEFKSIFLEDTGVKLDEIRSLTVSEGAVASVYKSGDLSGDAQTFEAGEHKLNAGDVGSIKVEA